MEWPARPPLVEGGGVSVQTKIEAKNLDFLSLMGFLSLNCPFS